MVIEKLAITIKRISFPSATVILDLFSLQDSQLAFATAGRGGGDFIENSPAELPLSFDLAGASLIQNTCPKDTTSSSSLSLLEL